MYQYCAALNCRNSRFKNPELSFFHFPKPGKKVRLKEAMQRSHQWWINTRRSDLQIETDYERIFQLSLCEEHFTSDQFMCPADKGIPKKRKNLRKDALPTVFTFPNAARAAVSPQDIVQKGVCEDDNFGANKRRQEAIKDQNNSGASCVSSSFGKVDADKQPQKSSFLEYKETSPIRLDLEEDCLLCSEESSCKLHQKTQEKVSEDQKSFKCKICKKILTSSWGLQQHLLIHLNCLLCSEESACETHRKRKEKVSKEQKSFQCELCKKILRSRWGLQQHLLAHTGVKEFKCQYCSKEFILRCDFRKHLKIHTGLKEYKCHLCTKEFILKADLNTHLRLHRKQKEYKCYLCEEEFFQKIHLTGHLKSHTELKELDEKDCPLCSEECACELHRKEEANESTDQKVFQCKVCNKILRSKWGLQQHLLTHTGLKEFKCHICSKEFVFNYALTSHLKVHSKHKEFKCQFCSKEFREKVVLKKHLKTHTGKREFKCHLCNKEFIQKINFQRHLITHDAQSGFKCEICSKVFKDKWNMKKHVASHTKTGGLNFQLPLNQEHSNQEFRCHICDDGFPDVSCLQQHMLKHNDQMIDVQGSASSMEDVNMTELEADPDVDPLLIEDEVPPVVKEEVSYLNLSEEMPSLFGSNDLIGNGCSVKTENDVHSKVFQQNICSDKEVVGDFVKVEEFLDYDQEVT